MFSPWVLYFMYISGLVIIINTIGKALTKLGCLITFKEPSECPEYTQGKSEAPLYCISSSVCVVAACFVLGPLPGALISSSCLLIPSVIGAVFGGNFM